MPRNGSSVYSLPAGNPVIPGTVIATTWANTTLTDIATALTNSLSTDGSTASVSLAGKTMSGGTFSGPSVTGVLTLTGGQIAFPAVAIPSAGANVLDDYEEGTWTPTATFQTVGNLNVVYSVRSGNYTKVGRLVTVEMQIVTTTFTFTTSAGVFQVTGLPFTCTGTSTALTCGTTNGMAAAGFSYVAATLVPASTTSQFTVTVVGTGANGVPGVASFTTGTNIAFAFSGTYQAA